VQNRLEKPSKPLGFSKTVATRYLAPDAPQRRSNEAWGPGRAAFIAASGPERTSVEIGRLARAPIAASCVAPRGTDLPHLYGDSSLLKRFDELDDYSERSASYTDLG
jgi:hypothetical protein